MEKRPFYLIAHRCNDADLVVKKIKQGANAIEVDVRHGDGVLYAKHDWPADGRKLSDFLQALSERLTSEPEELSQFSLINLDCKETDFDVNELLNLVREKLTSVIRGVNVVVSTTSFSDRSFFDQIKLSEGEAVSMGEVNHAQEVEDYFKGMKIPYYCYGTGAFDTIAAFNRPLNQAIRRTVAGNSFCLTYVWTLASKASMREYIDVGVDGIFVDEIEDLDAVLNESKYLNTVFRADRTDNPFGGNPRVPTYVLEVKTGNEVRAGTDANLTFELTGEHGVLSATIDAKPKTMFETGNTNFVVLSGTALGKILSLKVARDSSGTAPNWFLGSIAVAGPEIQMPIRFEYNQFIPTSGVVEYPVAVTYELTVQTADAKMAGTKAELTFELVGIKNGEKKSVKTTVDAKSTGMFKRGKQDTIMIGGEDIGEIFSLTVSRNDQGTSPNWNLEWISISRSDDSSKKLFFEFNDWIPETGVTEKPQNAYDLKVFTGDKIMAGTDANLTFTLNGTPGKSAAITVDTKPKGSCERGAINHFKVIGEDVGAFSSISIFNDGTGNGPNWNVLYIEVSNTEQSHRFLIDKWIDSGETVTIEV